MNSQTRISIPMTLALAIAAHLKRSAAHTKGEYKDIQTATLNQLRTAMDDAPQVPYVDPHTVLRRKEGWIPAYQLTLRARSKQESASAA